MATTWGHYGQRAEFGELAKQVRLGGAGVTREELCKRFSRSNRYGMPLSWGSPTTSGVLEARGEEIPKCQSYWELRNWHVHQFSWEGHEERGLLPDPHFSASSIAEDGYLHNGPSILNTNTPHKLPKQSISDWVYVAALKAGASSDIGRAWLAIAS